MKLQPNMYNLNNFTHKDFASVLNRYNYHLHLGDITAGIIFSKEKQGFLVDIGAPTSAYLPKDEICISKYQKNMPFINETREFFILAYNRKSKQLILSIKRLEYIRGWQRIKQLKNEDITINLTINNTNQGGLLTTIEGIQAFIPNSHLTNIDDKSFLINKKIKCQFLLINDKTNKVVFSNKRAILSRLLKTIYVGQITTGTITEIKDYGMFIKIYDFLALLHWSEIGSQDLQNKNIFKIGESISVQIIHIDKHQGRLSVSRRNLP